MFNKKVILTLLLSLIFIVIIALITDNKMDDENYKALFVHKVFTTKKYNVIIAGDSRIYRGISSEIISKNLHAKALNLGFSSGGQSEPLFNLIDKHLDKKSAKKIIILGITPASLTGRAAKNGHIERVLKRKKEEVLEYKYLFPVKLFFAPTTPYKIRKALKKRKSNDYRQEFHIDDGWIASWYDQPIPYRYLKDYKEKFTKMNVEENLIQNLYKKVSEWKSEGIEVYGFFIPSSDNMNELEKTVAGFDTKKFLKGFLKAGGYWINIENHYSSYDGSHLAKESAIRLSEEISQKILHDDIIKKYQDNLKINDIYGGKNYNFFTTVKINTDNSKIKLFNRNNEINAFKETILKETLSNLNISVPNKIMAEAIISYPDKNTEAIMGCEINGHKTEINTNYSTLAGKACKLFLHFDITENFKNNDTLEVYFKNKENKELFLDSIKIWYLSK